MSHGGIIGVVGAGTMGAGIAQLAAGAGCTTLVYDPYADVPAALERVRLRLARKEVVHGPLQAAGSLHDLAGCDMVIEAAPERLDVKQRLFAELAAIVGPACVLATNTSSIPVTAIAAEVPRPERVVGMHFFNPAPVMRLVEVIAGIETAPAALQAARALGEAMGKRVIDAADVPGFLVNRCNRPFGLEALKLLQERVADVETIDRIVRLAGGFRMGPFELQDLVGIDTGFAVSESFYALSFGEPRWRPSPLAARMVAAGRHGRKTGRGWYAYPEDGSPYRPDDPEPPHAGGGSGLIVVAGHWPIADELLEAAAAAGWDAREPADAEGEIPFLTLDCGADPDDPPLQGGPRAVLCAHGSLAALDLGGPAVGFHALPPLAESRLVELTRTPGTAPAAAAAAERFFVSLGKHVAWVDDAPGLVLARIVCQVINESAFSLGEGVGSAEDIDAGMVLGLNHPRGPLAWADAIGAEHVVAVLDALHEELGEERYRVAPVLRRLTLVSEETFHPV